MADAKKKPVKALIDAEKKATKKATVTDKKSAKAVTITKPPKKTVTATAPTEEKPAVEVKATAKAGKRSDKSLKAAEEKQAKEERKAVAADATDKPHIQQKPARTRLERRSKSYRKVFELLEKGKSYSLAEAVDLTTKTSPVKFDATVEMHFRLGVDPRQADQNIRDTIVLPAGTGKTVRIAVLADADDVATAKKAGADIAGHEEFLQQLEKGIIDFDVLISTPAMMPKLGKYARVLGPKGLMPNPKSGTVTNDVAKAVAEAKGGKVEYRVDSTGIVHLGIGKVSFGTDKLVENAQAVIASVKSNRPSSLKNSYVKSVYLTTSMGPSIAVDTAVTN
ncbi:MAG: hypothetical protein NVS1B7_7040 [Candidatus Saccharimonadales bacterium]